MSHTYDIIKPLSEYRVFISVSTGTKTITIAHETPELWLKTNWQVFLPLVAYCTLTTGREVSQADRKPQYNHCNIL